MIARGIELKAIEERYDTIMHTLHLSVGDDGDAEVGWHKLSECELLRYLIEVTMMGVRATLAAAEPQPHPIPATAPITDAAQAAAVAQALADYVNEQALMAEDRARIGGKTPAETRNLYRAYEEMESASHDVENLARFLLELAQEQSE